MIAISVAYLNVFAGKRNFSLNKAEKEKKIFVVTLNQCQRLEVREKATNVFCDEPTSA